MDTSSPPLGKGVLSATAESTSITHPETAPATVTCSYIVTCSYSYT
jgi:hypothetical protein